MGKHRKRSQRRKFAPRTKRARRSKSPAKSKVTTRIATRRDQSAGVRSGDRRAREATRVANALAGRGRRASAAKAPAQAVLAPTVLTVLNEDLARLGSGEAVDLIRELLWAEARRVGLSTAQINVSAAVNMPDGGIDASISAAPPNLVGSMLKPGRSSHQIKASSAFEPWNEAHLEKELFGKKRPGRDNLGESVRRCLDEDGTYVLVCTKCDLDELRHNKAIDGLKRLFSACGYRSPKVEVWSQNTIVGLLHRFASLRLKVNGRGHLRFQTHGSWSRQEEMTRAFKAGDPQRALIASLQAELRTEHPAALHARVLGEAGIGKTRLVYEVTSAEDLEPLVIYCPSASLFRDSDLMNEIMREDNEFNAILVVDECDPDDRAYIWDHLKNRGSRIKLITLHNEPERTSGTIRYVEAAPLGKEELIEIIHSYGIPKDRAARWTEYCGGSPRVAHVIGMNLKSNPDDILQEPATVRVWDRYIAGPDDPQSQNVQQRSVVLRHLALFKKFGYGGELVEEARAIWRLVQKADSSITWGRFVEIVEELRERKVLQGQATLYITPKLLHIKLWSDWWDSYGHGFNFLEFAEGLPESLVVWFNEMSSYARESKAAQRVVARLLDEGGIFQTTDYLEDAQGAKYFLALSEADPEGALRCLEKTVGTWSVERLLQFESGRREVVWALERIVIWRELFQRGARLLLKLAEAENETWGNNASGTFGSLFSPGWGATAPTEAPPQERFPVLKEALESDIKARRLLALKAADMALETSYFSRMAGAEHQGLRREPELWTPQTWGELFDAYRSVWQLLRERLDTFQDDERTKAADVLLQRAEGVARYANLFDMVMETLTEFTEKPYAPRRKMVEMVERVHYRGEDLSAEMRAAWTQLRGMLVGADFHSRMERYVGLDLLEDKFDGEGQQVDKAEPEIDRLASEAIERPEALADELRWLVREAANGFRFGYILGTKDAGFGLLPMLLDAQRAAGNEGNAFFLGGYLRAIREKSVERWETLLDELVSGRTLAKIVPELAWRGGSLTDRAARRVLAMARDGLLESSHFQMFAFGSSVADLSEDIFIEWVEFLLSTGTREAVSTALDLHYFYYGRKGSKHPLPKELTSRLLTAPALFEKTAGRSRAQMETYHWTELGKLFARTFPEESMPIADKMLEHFGEDGTVVERFYASSRAVLDAIMKHRPVEVWKAITKYIGPPVDSRAYHITHWLRGDHFDTRGETGALSLIPLDAIWEWADEDVERRAWYLASFVPKQLFRKEMVSCLAREVLVRYGSREDVRRNLGANFSSEGWSGPESLHLKAKRRELLEFKKGETDANVKRWIDEYVDGLNWRIERARIREERER
jgi:hypothetical protein